MGQADKSKKAGDENDPEIEIGNKRHLRLLNYSIDYRLALIIIFLVSFGLRLLYLYDISDHVFFRQLLVDQASYDEWANQIASGDWIGEKTFYQDPLYPYFLAVIYSLFGRNLTLVYVIQALMSALCIFPIYGMGRRVFNDPRVGILAAIFWGAYKVSFFYDAQVLKTSPGMALLILCLWLIILIRDRPEIIYALGAGLASGLLFVFRGNFLAVIPFVFAWLAYDLWKRTGRAAVPALAALIISCSMALGVIGARNYMVSGEFVLTTSQGGVNFYVGNYRGNKWGAGKDPEFARRTPVYEQDDFTAEAERRTGREMTAREVDGFWYGEGISEIKADPGLFVARLGRKTLLILNRHEVSDNLNYDFIRENVSWMLRLPCPAFWLAGPFGFAGLALALRKRQGAALAIFMLTYSATLLAFYVVGRYRMPLVPILLLFAAFGLVCMIDAIAARAGKELALYSIVFAISLALGYPEWQPPMYDDSYQKMGHAFMNEGKWSEAIHSYEQAVALNPVFGQAWLGMGMALERRHRWDEALYAFKNAADADPEFAPARYLLGRSLERKGLVEEAMAEYGLAVRLDPEFEKARKALEKLRRPGENSPP
jgi:tetratricopeptide (TPR) repeat protein